MEQLFHFGDQFLNVYTSQGKRNGKIYILLHGLFGTYQSGFSMLIPDLEKRGNTVIALDMLGHGKSSTLEKVTTDDLVNTALLFVRQEKLINKTAEIIVVGHSLGSIVGQKLAYLMEQDGYIVKHMVIIGGFYLVPDRIRRMLFQVSTTAAGIASEDLLKKFQETALYKSFVKMFWFYPEKSDEHFDEAYAAFNHANIEQIRSCRELFRSEEVISIPTDEINFRVINIRGDHDALSHQSDFLNIARHYGEKATSMLLPDCGHATLLEKPDAIRNVLAFFEHSPLQQRKSTGKPFMKKFLFAIKKKLHLSAFVFKQKTTPYKKKIFWTPT
ncbi:MAG: alpha/beta hydrolase [bacterium]